MQVGTAIILIAILYLCFKSKKFAIALGIGAAVAGLIVIGYFAYESSKIRISIDTTLPKDFVWHQDGKAFCYIAGIDLADDGSTVLTTSNLICDPDWTLQTIPDEAHRTAEPNIGLKQDQIASVINDKEFWKLPQSKQIGYLAYLEKFNDPQSLFTEQERLLKARDAWKIVTRKTKTLYVRGKGFAPGKKLPVGIYRCTREHDGSGGPDGLYCVKVGQ